MWCVKRDDPTHPESYALIYLFQAFHSWFGKVTQGAILLVVRFGNKFFRIVTMYGTDQKPCRSAIWICTAAGLDLAVDVNEWTKTGDYLEA